MKFPRLIAALASLGVASAFAAPAPGQIAISSGASASKNNLKIVLNKLCNDNAGVLTEFTDGSSNISTYTCATAGVVGTSYGTSTPVNFKNTGFAELRLNVNGGSFTAICLLNGFPAGTSCPVADLYVSPSTAGGGLVGTTAAPPAGSVIVGGLMDVEPGAFPFSVRQGLAGPAALTDAGFAQAFGVAVSNDLYTAMFNDQKAAGKLPSTCAVTDTAKPECVPVVGKAQMATIMFNNDFNAAYSNGANFLAPSIAAGTNLNYLRRVDTSGTQASAQNYFLGIVCGSAPLPVVGQGDGSLGNHGAITVFGLPTTGGVRTALNAAGYSIGIMSGENNQASQSWKWLRVGGMQMAENAQPDLVTTNTATALDGRYDYWFQSKVAQSGFAGVSTFWTQVVGGFAAVPAGNTKGLFASGETLYTKSGNACQNPSSN